MSAPLATVLIDTYNYGRFIEEAIDSVLSQDFPPDQMEIIVVDDGSTDDTAERVQKYGPRIQYLQKPNGGQASAFNYGFAKARGEIIALLDADDYWLPGKLRRIVEEFENHPQVGMIYHQLVQLDSTTNTLQRREFIPRSGYLPHKSTDLFWYFPYPSSFLAFRRNILQQLLPIPGSLRIQADAYPAILALFLAPVLALSEPLAVYRVHGQNLFFGDETSLPPAQRRRRTETRQILIDEITAWLKQRSFDISRPPIRPFLDRWVLYQQRELFAIDPPGRIDFFRHLLLYNSCYGPRLSRRLRFLNHFSALGALLTGYKHFPSLEKAQREAIETVRRPK